MSLPAHHSEQMHKGMKQNKTGIRIKFLKMKVTLLSILLLFFLIALTISSRTAVMSQTQSKPDKGNQLILLSPQKQIYAISYFIQTNNTCL